tara:strand:+ start:1050 stop:2858 length:1809 start_codon:yes stop_codon:yes gene_type:complete
MTVFEKVSTPLVEMDSEALFKPAGSYAALPDLRTFEQKTADALIVIKRYLLLGYTLALAFSGGKDSSVMLSLCFRAIRELMSEGIDVPKLHILHSDTLIENPVVKNYNKRQLRVIKKYAETNGIPARVWVASPGLSNDYLVSIIGGRTIASVGNNSKCQQMMKSAPLAALRSKVKKQIAAETGVKPKHAKIISVIGTRFDESATRGRKMTERGESASDAVEAMSGSGELVLSPIADFTMDNVFEYIGKVRSGQISNYDSWDELVAVYRDMNNGDCMVTAYIGGTEAPRAPCSARTGCWGCLRVSRDTSAENMISSDGGEFGWLKPLNDFRNYLQSRHFDPSARTWLSRSVDADGMITIAPNAYSPEFTLELLRMALTIQAREIVATRHIGIAPRFTILSLKQVLAIDLLWSRYGYQAPFTALRTYIAVYQDGMRWDIPDISTTETFTEKDVSFRKKVPFADESFGHAFNGLRNIDWAAAGCEETIETPSGRFMTNVNTGSEFSIDEEGLALFVEFEMEHALKRISIDDAPSAAAHYLLGLGTVQLAKGKHGDWDRMFRMSNQIHRLGLRPILNDPLALAAKLSPASSKRPQERAPIVQGSLF